MPDTDMVAWYLGILDQREQIAKTVNAQTPSPWTVGSEPGGDYYLRAADGREFAISCGCCYLGTLGHEESAYIVSNDPATELADIAAKRKIVARWKDPDLSWQLPDGATEGSDPDEIAARTGAAGAIDHVVRLLVAAQAHRPGYREEWRP